MITRIRNQYKLAQPREFVTTTIFQKHSHKMREAALREQKSFSEWVRDTLLKAIGEEEPTNV